MQRKASLPRWLARVSFSRSHRADDGERVLAGQRLGVVVEVDQQRLVVTGLDEAVGVAVEGPGHRSARDVLEEVVDEDLDREVRDRAGLGGGDVAGVADGEDVVVRRREQGVLVDGHVVELVAEPRAGDEVGAHVQRDRHQQVERAPRARRRRPASSARASIRSTMKSVSTWILRSSSIPPRCAEATGLVNAPSSGVT